MEIDPAGHVAWVASASWSIPALAEKVVGVRQAAVQFSRANGVPEERLHDLGIAVSEAVTNAVVHAFRSRDPGTVTVTVDVTAGELVEVAVRDDGIGMSRALRPPGVGLRAWTDRKRGRRGRASLAARWHWV